MKYFVLLSAFLVSVHSNAQKLELSRLNDSSYVFTTWQLYISKTDSTLYPANGFIKVTSAGVLLIDTPWDTTQFQPLLDSIEKRFHSPVKWVISTHSHADRTAGLTYYKSKGIATYTSFSTRKICQERGEPQPEFVFYHDTVFQLGATKVQTFFPGAGHTPDNIVIWFPEEKILYGGCFIKSVDAEDIGNRADANFGTWPMAVRLVQRTFKHPKWIIPGHESWKSKKALKHTRKLIRKA
ncbi:MAG TPA: subclass B1 metallo-beta-lactamase [Fluviicola sp.]|nr:subclass B1 metallo-beta-lactamase [Fluviicola sp.]